MSKTPVEQLASLQADRLTLLLFVVIWLGMIVGSFLVERPPWYALGTLAVLTLVRYIAYHYYRRRITSMRRNPGN